MGPILLLTLSLSLGHGPASAQAGPPGGRGQSSQHDRDAQRREEIRASIRSSRQLEVASQGPIGNPAVLAPPPPYYHLSPKGKAELREQLRREQYESSRGRP